MLEKEKCEVDRRYASRDGGRKSRSRSLSPSPEKQRQPVSAGTTRDLLTAEVLRKTRKTAGREIDSRRSTSLSAAEGKNRA